MNAREKEYLKALRDADEALYQLGKKTPIDTLIFHATNKFQTEMIHPEIKRMKGEAA